MCGKNDPCDATWVELSDIFRHSDAGGDADFDRRLAILSDWVEFCNMRDWHIPYAKSHPPPHQSCAKFARGTQALAGYI